MTFLDKPVEAVLFDMDGTLVDSEAIWQVAEAELVTSRGYTLDTSLHASFTGIVTPLVIRTLRQAYGLTESEAALTRELYARLRVNLEHVTAREGATDLVNHVAQSQIPFALASNSDVDIIEIALKNQPWRELFRYRFSAQQVAHAKPAPDLFLHAAAQLGVTPARCLVLEDSLTGVQAAVAAGMLCAAVPEGGDLSVFRALTPYVYTDLRAVTEALQGGSTGVNGVRD